MHSVLICPNNRLCTANLFYSPKMRGRTPAIPSLVHTNVWPEEQANIVRIFDKVSQNESLGFCLNCSQYQMMQELRSEGFVVCDVVPHCPQCDLPER